VENIKAFNVRLPKELWAFLKKKSIEQEKPMNVIIMSCLSKFKEKCDKKEVDKT
jgi:hypothetical protein